MNEPPNPQDCVSGVRNPRSFTPGEILSVMAAFYQEASRRYLAQQERQPPYRPQTKRGGLVDN